jgi:hypothetical protein
LLNGPQATVRRQHWVGVPTTVVDVVVTLDVVVGQLAPLPGAGHASQQLEHEPAVPPFLAHIAGFVALHLSSPFFVRQQVTKPGLPQVDEAAHRFTRPRQLRFTSVASTCCAAQLT